MDRPTQSLRNRVFTFVGLLVLVSLVGSGWTLVRVGGVNQILDGLRRSWLSLGRELSQVERNSGSLKQELERSLGYRQWADVVNTQLSQRRFSSPDWLFDEIDSNLASIVSQVESLQGGELSEILSGYLSSLRELREGLKRIEARSTELIHLLEGQKWTEAQKSYPEWNRELVQWNQSVEKTVSEWEVVSRETFDRALSRIEVLRAGLRLSLFSAVLLSLLLLWLAERALRPLGHLSLLAREITRRGLGREDKELLSRLPLHRGDEVSLLARDFHSMASSLLERERVVMDQTRQLEEQNRQLRELNRLRERLREAESMAAIGRLSAQVAHEVRNPLHAIGLDAELAIERVRKHGDGELQRSLQGILEGVERLSQITENYLKFSKPTTGRTERFDLGEALDSVLATYGSECQAQSISIDWKRTEAPAALEVLADREAVEQALGNLMRNSIQALEGMEDARICWSLGMLESGRVWVRIEDNGPGIPLEIRNRLFAPFSTTKAQGTGLGLSWVKRVIEEQGGQVEAHQNGIWLSEARPGASFSMVFAQAPEQLAGPVASLDLQQGEAVVT